MIAIIAKIRVNPAISTALICRATFAKSNEAAISGELPPDVPPVTLAAGKGVGLGPGVSDARAITAWNRRPETGKLVSDVSGGCGRVSWILPHVGPSSSSDSNGGQQRRHPASFRLRSSRVRREDNGGPVFKRTSEVRTRVRSGGGHRGR